MHKKRDKRVSGHPDKDDTSLSKFLFGFANSTFQSSGEQFEKSNWSDAALTGTVPSASVGQFISHWQNFETDLNIMKKIGVNGYRFSIEWSQIELEPGVYDERVLARYGEMIEACRARDIEPVITLYHFTEPSWFNQRGSFLKTENIKYFLSYCEMIFKRFEHQVTYWCTINEPASHAFSSYLYGQFPPHKHSVKLTVLFLKNLLMAHVAVYKKLKQLPGGEHAKIGIVHHVLKFLPRYKWEPLEVFITKFITEITHTLVMNFFSTGHYDYNHWFLHIKHYDPDAPQTLDFMGLNFYGNPVVGFNSTNFFGPTHFPHQETGDFPVPIDSAGFADAIKECAALKKPIIITETGIADESDKARCKLLREYLSVLHDKICEKVDIRGCFIWTFSDNYEWDHGFKLKFGLHDHFRTERASVNEFKEFMTRIRKLSECD